MFSKDKREKEIISIQEKLNYLFDHSVNDENGWSKVHLENLRDEYALIPLQCDFWDSSHNYDRKLYDLEKFGMWFIKKIGEVKDLKDKSL